MGDIQKSDLAAFPSQIVNPDSGPFEFVLPVWTNKENRVTERIVRLSIARALVHEPLTFYSIPLQDPYPSSPLPLQIRNNDTGPYPYIPLRSVIRLLVLADSGARLAHFNPPLSLYFKLDAMDVVKSELLDLILPDNQELDPAKVSEVASRLRSEPLDGYAIFQAAVERWQGVFQQNLPESDPDRIEWFKEQFVLFTAPEDHTNEYGESWQIIPIKPIYGAPDPEPERAGIMLGAEIEYLPDIDPVVARKPNHRKPR